jgi:cytochrome c oxidase cbb3-type subunit 4
MDINDLRSAFTVLSLVVFIGVVWWAYSDRRKVAYDEAARLPLDDEDNVLFVTNDREEKSS